MSRLNTELIDIFSRNSLFNNLSYIYNTENKNYMKMEDIKMEDIGKIIYQFYEQTKPVIIVFWAWILSILTPVETVLCILGVAFIFNIICGVITGVNVQKEPFDKKKFLSAFLEAIVISACVVFVNTMFIDLGDSTMADITTKTILYLSVYVYSVKALANLTKLFPSWTIINVLHDVLTTAVLAKLKDSIGMTNKTKIDEL